jgi:hypothetical protein
MTRSSKDNKTQSALKPPRNVNMSAFIQQQYNTLSNGSHLVNYNTKGIPAVGGGRTLQISEHGKVNLGTFRSSGSQGKELGQRIMKKEIREYHRNEGGMLTLSVFGQKKGTGAPAEISQGRAKANRLHL